MTPTLYENRPGGTIVKFADGTTDVVAYGVPYVGKFAPENLVPHQANELESHADTTQRLSDSDISVAQAREAHARAALDNAGQPNSSQSPVPGNYGELDENAASQLVGALAAFPEQQASVLYHEILFGGNRRRVIDAGSQQAHISARMRIAALTPTQALDTSEPLPGLGSSVASAGDPDRLAATLRAQGLAKQPQPTAPTPSGVGSTEDNATKDAVATGAPSQEEFEAAVRAATDAALTVREAELAAREEAVAAIEQSNQAPAGAYGWDGKEGVNSEGYWTKANLEAYAAQHSIDVSGASNRDQLKSKLAVAGHAEPQTPPPGQ